MKTIIPVLLAAALAFRIFVMSVALAHPERVLYGEDSHIYNRLASNLLLGRGFTLHCSPPFKPSITRVPVYPYFLASIMELSGRYNAAVTIVMQNILAVATALLLYAFLNKRCGAYPALIALFVMLADVANIACSNFFMTEIVFLFLSVSAFILFIRLIEADRKFKYAILAGMASAGAALCRPIYVYLPYILAGVGLFAMLRTKKRFVGAIALFIVVYILGLSPWLARNYRIFQRLELSYLKAVHAYLYKAGGAIAIAEHRNIEDVKDELERRAFEDFGIGNINEDPHWDELRGLTLNTIYKHPASFGISTAMGVTAIAIWPDKGKISWLMGKDAPEFGFLWQERRSLPELAGTFMRMGFLEIALIVFQLAVFLFIYGAIVWGIVKKRFSLRDPLILAASVAIAYFFIMPAGPEIDGRFRIPATPYLAILVCSYFGGGIKKRGRSVRGSCISGLPCTRCRGL